MSGQTSGNQDHDDNIDKDDEDDDDHSEDGDIRLRLLYPTLFCWHFRAVATPYPQ